MPLNWMKHAVREGTDVVVVPFWAAGSLPDISVQLEALPAHCPWATRESGLLSLSGIQQQMEILSLFRKRGFLGEDYF